MIAYLFIAGAAFFNACMDAFENSPNFNESIFRNFNKKFWLKEVSWKYARKIFDYKLDAWHLSKSLMILSFAGAFLFAIKDPPGASWWVILLNIGLIWNITFFLVYHKLFGIK